MKYRGGRVPPLVAGENGSECGLLDEKLLKIFQQGFSATYSIPLFVSSVSESRFSGIWQPKQEGNSSHHRLNCLPSSCKYFRSIQESVKQDIIITAGSEEEASECRGCFLLKPDLIARDGKAEAYMCHIGMIVFAIPVRVAGKIVAVLSSECKKPQAGKIWPEGFFGQNIYHSPVAGESPTATKIDLWQESKRRIRECEELLSLESGELLNKINERVETDPEFEASPEIIEIIMSALENAGTHLLSEMTDKTYRLEKESVIGWLRAEMASALSSVDTFWDKIRWCLEDLACFMGADYILLISRDKVHASSFSLQCQYGLPEESLPVVQYDWTGSTMRAGDFVKKMDAFEHGEEMDLRQYRDVPILGMLYSLYGRGVSYPVFVTSTTTLDGGLTFMILGKRETGVQSKSGAAEALKWLREDDRRYLMTIVRELAIITSVFFSMKKLQNTVEEQTYLMESVAHDLKTPIQNIMIAAENLRECRVDPERASRTITGVVTQLQRLNLLAQKAWMLEQIRLDKLVYNDEQQVSPYQIFVECKELLIDMAERASIDIHIDPDIENWLDIRIDAEMFRIVVLNLLHNGIKYAFANTCVKIGGWQDSAGAGVSITFENKGIRIRDEEKDRIFERYFRSKDAMEMDPAGSGIGLALVKEFVDHYEGKIDVRSTEVGFGEYLNVFSLFLSGR